jgi:HEAT repeat protein
MDTDVPKEVRRRILEGSVRAPQDWHQEAIRDAYSSDDESWRLTAVFGMGYIRGFNTQILEALENENEDIHYEAVCAAGDWEVDAAWSHIASLATTELTDKSLRLAAIEAVASIRPQEAAEILIELTQSDDEDIVDAAYEAMAMSGWFPDEDYDYDDEDEDEKVLH